MEDSSVDVSSLLTLSSSDDSITSEDSSVVASLETWLALLRMDGSLEDEIVVLEEIELEEGTLLGEVELDAPPQETSKTALRDRTRSFIDDE